MRYLLCIIILVGCNSTPTKPTPFTTSDSVNTPYGCQKLREEVELYNKTHEIKKVGDC